MLLLSLGCTQDSLINEIEKELALSPPVLDFGDAGMGETLELELQLDNLQGGDISLRDVHVTTHQGVGFSVIDFPDIVPAGGTAWAVLAFTAEEPGWHWGLVGVTSDATLLNDAQVRGHAGEAELQVWPAVLDFGYVAAGDQRSLPLYLSPAGEVDSRIYEALVEDPAYLIAEDFPLLVEEMTALDITFAPEDDEEHVTTLVLDNNGDEVTVILRGNSCDGSAGQDRDGDGYTPCGGDCDDDDPSINPSAVEVYDDVDEDCDGTVDEGTEGYDDDGDGYTELEGDCNDGNDAQAPDIAEEANGIDDDCDGVIDDGVGNEDADGDGFLDWAGDCDDNDPDTYPGAPELPDGVDNDCDGVIDEGTINYDDDGDGYSEADGDCNDNKKGTYPGASEKSDQQDNDCDGIVDEGTDRYDDDGDGYTERGGDCDDADASVSPAELEVEDDGIDNDCDGTVD